MMSNGHPRNVWPAMKTTRYACPRTMSAMTVGDCNPTASAATDWTSPHAQLLATTAQSVTLPSADMGSRKRHSSLDTCELWAAADTVLRADARRGRGTQHPLPSARTMKFAMPKLALSCPRRVTVLRTWPQQPCPVVSATSSFVTDCWKTSGKVCSQALAAMSKSRWVLMVWASPPFADRRRKAL